MRTNQNYTFSVLDAYLTAGKIDINYIAHCVVIVADNDRPTSELKYNTRRPARNIAIEWLMYFIKTELYYNFGAGYYATNKQVMAWDKAHAGQLEKVLDIVTEYIKEEQNENNN